MPDASTHTRATLAHAGRLLRHLAARLGAEDARPRQMLAGYAGHLIAQTEARQHAAGIDDGDFLELTLRGLLPARLGSAIVYLDASAAEASVEEIAAFIDVASEMAAASVAEATDARELTDAVIASLDLLHSFLIANELVSKAYVDACAGGWIEHALNAMHPKTSDPEAYETVLEREPSTAPTRDAANPRDLALAA